MVRYTIWSNPTPQSHDYLTPETADVILNKYKGLSNETCENLKSLIAKNEVLPKALDDILPLNDLCNHKKYVEFLRKNMNFLKKNQVMDRKQFSNLFLKWSYNKADINQGKLWICKFDAFLWQLKETPFFETLIRCSLQRNENNNWWKCLIPFCNNEWNYEEISDDDIDYLKTSKIWEVELISNSSLWFNILETLLVKMIWNKKRYPNLAHGRWKFRNKPLEYNDLKTVSPQDLKDSTYWINTEAMRDTFIWQGIIKSIWIIDFTDENLEWLINLMKTRIIKLSTWIQNEKIRKYKEHHKEQILEAQSITDNTITNEPILNKRWYTHKVNYKVWPKIYIWKAKNLWETIRIEGTTEWFVQSHAYYIENIYSKNWEKLVTIRNPRYSWKKIDIPLEYMKEFFYVWIYCFDIDKMFIKN